MRSFQSTRSALSAAAALILGATIACAGSRPAYALQPAPSPTAAVVTPAAAAPVNPALRTLDANLWQETSAEYRACCLQAYALATARVNERTADMKGALPPAVIMDLDETVLDNSSFQAHLDHIGSAYTGPIWDDWEKNYPDDTRLVPGAKDFIKAAAAKGVTVIYITNRLISNTPSTIEALKHNGISTEDIENRVYGKDDPKSSDKTARRKIVEAKYHVILYVGDNLRDFSEEFATPRLSTEDGDPKAVAARAAAVDKARAHFGDDWIILPNAVYGEWQNALGTNGHGQLRKSAMDAPVEAKR